MVFQGTIRGRFIELDEPLPFKDGQPVSVTITRIAHGEPRPGSTVDLRRIMHEAPHVDHETLAEFERVIEEERQRTIRALHDQLDSEPRSD